MVDPFSTKNEESSDISMLQHGRKSKEKSGSAIVISGCARSGTSIIGKLIHSFQNVEYSYEPPLLVSLFSLIDTIKDDQWKLLYETYLYEEILINSISGRSINCNLSDDSSIFEVKDLEEINKRLSNSTRKLDAEILAMSSHISYKIPDIAPKLDRLKQYYPSTRIVFTRRKAEPVFASILQKKWFNDENLSAAASITFPCRIVAGKRIPFWVSDDDTDDWLGSDELHRIAYYYIAMNSSVDFSRVTAIINYEDLILDPCGVINDCATKLGLSFGDKTQGIISSIYRSSQNVQTEVFDTLKPSVLEKVKFYSESFEGGISSY